MDDPALNEYNVQQVVQTFLNSVAGAHKMSRGERARRLPGYRCRCERACLYQGTTQVIGLPSHRHIPITLRP